MVIATLKKTPFRRKEKIDPYCTGNWKTIRIIRKVTLLCRYMNTQNRKLYLKAKPSTQVYIINLHVAATEALKHRSKLNQKTAKKVNLKSLGWSTKRRVSTSSNTTQRNTNRKLTKKTRTHQQSIK